MASLYSTIPSKATKPPTSYKIKIPETTLSEFTTLLELSKIAAPTFENQMDDRRFGVSAKWLADAKEYWLNKFDWREKEAHINSFPHFMIGVEEEGEKLDIHFMALFSEREDAIPIVLLHGWPGSFLEFIPLFTLMREQYTPQTLPYHLIVPSHPGYAFSSTPPLHKEFGVENIASCQNQVMQNLGFGEGYIAQGGDIGSSIARIMTADYASCKALHLNTLFGSFVRDPSKTSHLSVTAAEQKGVDRMKQFIATGSAYAFMHATRPSTISLVLASNPLALLAWIGEKFLAWTDVDPDIETILEAVSLYWFTETFPRAIYPYRQGFKTGKSAIVNEPDSPEYFITKPFGYSWYPLELSPMPRSWVEKTGDLSFHRVHDKGGHFAALEQPEIFKEDLEAFVQQVWK
jgi:microsomal epoxide hydrolase